MWKLAVVVGVSLDTANAGQAIDHCTAFAAGAKATADGAPMVGQAADAAGGPGTSVVFVPAQDHAPGSTRPVIDQLTWKVIGHIPQVAHTFAYTYASYGIMNEHKLAFGESTCSARITAASLAHNGTALFSDTELSRIALERCKTARCAIETMGHLATTQGGFYGETVLVDAGGETLVVADTAESWVFHILADPTGRSAIWGAQRVPDGHVAFVPNSFVVREMNLSNTKDFLLSENAQSIACHFGWSHCRPDGEFNFAQAFSLGEYNNPYYSARRMWRAIDLVAPSLHLSPTPEITPFAAGYPFSVKPDELLTPRLIMRVYRDYFEGTPFSLVADKLAAGPFNSPRRISAPWVPAESKVKTGAWERPISMHCADYAVFSQCHPEGNGIVWFAPHTPHASVFAPIWTSAAAEVPQTYAVNRRLGVDRSSLFWAASAVSNWAHGSMFSRAIVDIRAAQAELEPRAEVLAERLRASTESARAQTQLLAAHAAGVHGAWWDLFWSLMGKYNDGYVVTHDVQGWPTATAFGYPSWWLEAVGFDHGVAAEPDSFEQLRKRMADAAKVMAAIDAARNATADFLV